MRAIKNLENLATNRYLGGSLEKDRNTCKRSRGEVQGHGRL